MCLLSLAVPAFATHDAVITISPGIANCDTLGNLFTAAVKNSASSIDSIFEVRIYEGTISAGFACGAAPGGWTLYDFTSTYGYCEYKTTAGGAYMIDPSEKVDFTFKSVMSAEGCSSEFLISTLDDARPVGEHEYNYPKVFIDCKAPVVVKNIGAPIYQTGGNTFINQQTEISVDATEDQTCDLGVDYCTVNYNVDGVPHEPLTFKDGSPLNFDFYFKEDSRHDVTLTCYDKAGNSTTITETDYVETVPPGTTKTLGEPKFIEKSIEWITTSTPITLNAVDPDPHPSGIDKTWYLNTIDKTENSCRDPTTYCTPAGFEYPAGCINNIQDYCTKNWDSDYKSWEECVQDMANAECGFNWTLYTGTFKKDTESCHILTYFSVDNLGQIEKPKVNCFFVDDTPPVFLKRVWTPNVPCTDGTCDYYITQDTIVNLGCKDQEPHPSDNVTIHWSYTVDGGTPITGNAPGPEYELKFSEDSVHVLEAWCTDAVGNESDQSEKPGIQHDIETFRVDTAAPEIKKTMLGTAGVDYLGECPPGAAPIAPCYVADNGKGGVHVDVKDPDPTGKGCNVDKSECTYNLWWDTTIEACEAANGLGYDTVMKCLLAKDSFGEKGTDILFHQDSTHTMVINCKDALGNAMTEDVEKFLVDSTPPVTAKTYGTPFYTDGYSDWITTKTPITLAAKDAKVGVDGIYYRYCLYKPVADGPQTPIPARCTCDKIYSEYSKPFSIIEESQHCIEFYSTDLFGNAEQAKSQLVFVEDTPPKVTKTVGEPKVACSGSDPAGCDYYITQQTPIILSCTDPEPHPADNVTNLYRYRLSEDCSEWGGWTDWMKGGKEIYFKEDSCHEIEYKCEDALGNATQVYKEIDIVDTAGPAIAKEIVGPKIGDCPPRQGTDDVCYIDGVTTIAVTAVDPQPHPVGQAACKWSYTLDALDVIYGPYTSFPIQFPEETMHNLTIECKDALGNTSYDKETFFVDKTPPETKKWYGKPAYPAEGYPKWITSQTPVYLKADDAGPHKSGVKEVNYRVSLVGDEYCNDQKKCQAGAPGITKEYDKASPLIYGSEYDAMFTIPEESCHMVEYYGVDNVGKAEAVKRQCVFVDNTAPIPVKTVGEPKGKWTPGKNGDAGSTYYSWINEKCWLEGEGGIDCWKVTVLTPISLQCTDPQPHPVDKSKVCFNVEVDGTDITKAKYCGGDRDYNKNGDGYCCMRDTTKEFYFGEETEHNLKYYCVDALGNKGPVDEEKFKVEGTRFEIQINKKWNLISVPFTLIDSNIRNVLKNIDKNVESVWTYDAATGQWYVYNPQSPGTSNLATMDPGRGYWLKAYNKDKLIIGGSLFSPTVTPPSRDLTKGWNLVGYYGTKYSLKYEGPFGNGRQSKCALYSLGETELDKGWTALLTYWEPSNPNVWKELGYYSKMDPGAGYWISLPEEGLYSYSTTCGFVYDPEE